ncbi:apolipoprotein N-acyltransferase [Paludibacterium paludis]|uniref:Apolipoprotein N-acyltransferase n=1 Tax=Paludibacterium paludis TaxID=1225769 RepID=A0A918P4Z9_9NEIS|nr:apolipoprotein N-acyltransferase [Paludibacterium paludis]GGY18211.1 apolipoprotein N-acyltransferase [Paludibacterium paludis]
MRFLFGLLTAIFAGASTVYSFAPYRLFWLMPLALAALAELSVRFEKRAFWIGYAWGLAAYLANFYWIYHSLHDIAGMPAPMALPITALLPAYLALYPGLAAWITVRLALPRALRWLVTFPCVWTLTEWLRSWVFTGFPWGQAGYSQITESPLAGYTSVGGIYAVTALVALSAGALVLMPRLANRGRLTLLTAALAVWSSGAFLKTVDWTSPVGKPFSVALAQGNIPQEMKWDPANFAHTLRLYYTQAATTRADLMLLPETALPLFLDDLPSGYLTMLKGSADRQGMALATGIPRRTPDNRGYLNAVVAITTEGMPYYAKDHLVPFSEFIPLRWLIGGIYQFMNMPLADFTPGGQSQTPLALAGQKIAFNVCYEDGFGEELIGSAKNATVLANVSNLAWFGRSNAASQQLQLSQARSMETGRYMLRATNTGMTAIIRPDGEVGSIAAPFTEQILTGYAQGRTGMTPYMKTGNLPVIAGCALLFAGMLALGVRRRRLQPEA